MRRAKPRLEPHIETERLVLRPLAERDLDAIFEGVRDRSVAVRLARVPHPYRRADAGAFLTRTRAGVAAGREMTLGVEHDGALIGCIGLGDIPRICELGYWFARPHWGKGFATEAARAVVAYGFDALGLRLVRSGAFSDNPASLRVQMKLGFRRTGLSERRSLARGHGVAHIDTVLTRARFRDANPHSKHRR